ncbi:MAG: hypothetical protein SFU25_11180, partial [Candidatus Caenarcaniphilales bacterium]|nr:hypothetical protein [Candidatus Caenarcaniphilales bacterium]
MDAKEQKTGIKKVWLLFGTPFVIMLFGIFSFWYISNINLWWSEVEKFSIKQFGAPLKCEKKLWTGLGKIALIKCTTSNNTLSVQELRFSLFGSKLYLKSPFIKLKQSEKSKILRFPNIPNFINTIIVDDLFIKDYITSESESTSESTNTSTADTSNSASLVPLNKLNRLELNRSNLFVNQWNTKALIDDNALLAKGLIGNKIDLELFANKLKFKLDEKNQLLVTGAVELKTKYLGKALVKASSKELLLSIRPNQDDAQRSAFRDCNDFTLKGSINLTKDLKSILDFENLNLKSSFLTLASSPNQSTRLILQNTKLDKLSKCATKLSQAFSSNPILVNSNSQALVTGYIQLPEEHLEKRSEILPKRHLEELIVSLEIPEKFNLNLQKGLDRYSAEFSQFKITARPLKRSLRDSSGKELANNSLNSSLNPLQKFGVQELNLSIEDFDFSSLTGLVKRQNLKTLKGHLKGNINYTDPLNLKAYLDLSALEVTSDKPYFSLKNGKGSIRTEGQSILINLDSLASLNQNGSYEPLTATGKLNWQWQGTIDGNLEVNARNLSVLQNNPSKEISLLKGFIKNTKANIQIKGSKFSSLKANGQLENFLASLSTLQDPIYLKSGTYNLTYASNRKGLLSLSGLDVNYNNSKSFISTAIALNNKSFQPSSLSLKGEVFFDDIKGILDSLPSAQKTKQNLKDFGFEGSLNYDVAYAGQKFTKLQLNPKNFLINYKGNRLFDELKGDLKLDKKGNLAFQNLQLRIGNKSRFNLEAQLPPIQRLMAISNSAQLNNTLQNLEIRIRGMVNPHDLINTLVERTLIQKPTIEFDELISVPVFARAFPRGKSLRFNFGTNFYKVQIGNGKVFLSQDLSNVEEIFGNGEVDFRAKTVTVNELSYKGKNFGILGNLNVKPKSWSFNLESAP